MASSRKSPKNSSLLARTTAVVERHMRCGERLAVGLSGGIDSVVLLDLLHRVARRGGIELAAVHVNHQLNPNAPAWARFCRALCRGYGIPLSVKKVEVKRGNSLEASARAARYAVYAGVQCDAVALAHNQDDQVETLLLQLLRGSGVKGVSAMPEFRIENPALLRPLLDVPRSEIVAYARARKLAWVEDDSNADTAFDRNFLRHRLLPVIAERFPAYRQTLSRASRNFAEAAALLDAWAVVDAGGIDDTLDLARLRGLSAARVKNTLRHFLSRHGVRMPNARRIEEFTRQLMRADPADAIVLQAGAHDLRGYGGRLHVVAVSGGTVGRPDPVRWRGEKNLALPQFGGVLTMKPKRGRGISRVKIKDKILEVRARAGGERLRLGALRPSRTLKNLWQEARTPQWLREGCPLLFAGDALVYVPGLGVDAGFRADKGEPGIEPGWEPHSA
jgi:tRNA(Ile)-lysidine synthase